MTTKTSTTAKPLVAIALMYASAAGAAVDPVAVSPGAADRASVVEEPCPTFSWGAAAGAATYELLIFELSEGLELGEATSPTDLEHIEPTLSVTLPGGATSWTPAQDRCMRRGSSYAWLLRAHDGRGQERLSDPKLFAVAGEARPGDRSRRPAPGAKAKPTPVSEALVDGSGTPNVLTKWTDGINIGDSTISEVGGFVGIGTTAPGSQLDVVGASSGNLLHRFWNTSTGGVKMRFAAGLGAQSQVEMVAGAEWLAAVNVDPTTGLQFRVRGSTSPNTEAELANSPRMTIKRDGSVLIGTMNTSVAKLTVENTGLSTIGVFGRNHGGIGVAGTASVGVMGVSSDMSGSGVIGMSQAGNSTGSGVEGRNGSPTGRGVKGLNTATTGSAYAVTGESLSSPSGTGVYGAGTFMGTHGFSSTGRGVVGSSNSGTGVAGTGNWGVRGDSQDVIGVLGASVNGVGVHAESGNGNPLEAYSGANRVFHVDNFGKVFAEGSLQIGGSAANGTAKVVSFGNQGCSGPCVSIGEADADNRMVLRAAEFRVKGGNLLPDSDGGQMLGIGGRRWNAVWAAIGTIQTSDVRLKKDVADLRYGLHEVLQLRPVSYEWKDRPDGRQHLGLIAQEVQSVLPETVVVGSDPAATLGMNYSDLVPVLIRAIQELEGRVTALAADNAQLAARITRLDGAGGELRVATGP